MTKLSATVMGYLHKIWDSLSKPAGKEDSKIEDFFDFAFVGLPHKVFAREAFESAVSKFRAKFNDKKHPEYVFKPNYHKHIPADGFPMFAESIWAKIISNRDLDLPTQTQLLAQHRCDEIAKEVYEKFTAAIVKFKAPLESGQVPESFGSETNALTSSLLDEFDSAASRYHAAVYQEKRSEFFDRMATALNVFYVQLLTNLHKQGVEMFKSSLQSKVTADESGGFMVKMRESMLEAETFYKTGAEAAKLKGASWENDKHLAKFLEAIRLIADEKRAEAISKMIAAFEKSAKTTMSESVQFAMNDASPTMWKSIVTAFKNFLDLTNAQLRKKCSGAYFIESCGAKLREADVLDDLGFESSEEEITNLFNAFRWQSWQILLEAIQKETADEILLGRLKARFEAKFRYDDKGVPRIWKLDDPIDNFFKAASDDVEKLIVMFARIDVPLQMIPSEIIEDENFNPSCLTVLNAAHLQTVRDRFKKDADMLFIEAKRSMVITTAKIPFWFVALTIILGWNEFMTVLSSPLYFIMLAILGGGAYTVWYLGMVGPLYSVVKATSKEVANQTRTALEDRGVSVDNILNGKVFQDPASIVGAPKRGNGTSNSPSPSPSSSSKKSDEYEMKGESRTVNQKVSAGGLSERRGYSVDAQ
ncbi:Dynamin-like GTPase that mediates homotypic ER fusion [Irineochytrium annulatum]|nr:Dynamin-like GTPase that mediates homotypic ER fusion [Irineochytrium annulatum]